MKKIMSLLLALLLAAALTVSAFAQGLPTAPVRRVRIP